MLDFPKTHKDALLLSAQYSDQACIRELLAKFVIDYHIVDHKKNNVLHKIMMRDKGQKDKQEVLNLFYDKGEWHGLDLNACNEDGYTILDMVAADELDLAEFLESKGAMRAITMSVIIPPLALQFDQYQKSSLLKQQIVPQITIIEESKLKLN
jgi:hypothetical protein